MMNREEHLAWCKTRAREYLDRGDVRNAIASMSSDMSKHPETKCDNPFLIQVGMMAAVNNDVREARRWIDGFN